MSEFDATQSMTADARRRALRIVVLYGVAAGIYIWASDLLLGYLIDDPKSIVSVQIVKGSLFVLTTALLLLFLLRRAFLQVAQATEEAVHGRKLLQSIFGTSESGLILVDRVGRVDAWNEQAASILGWREQEVLGKPFPVIDRGGSSCALGSFVRDVLKGHPGGTDVVLVRDRFQRQQSLRVRLDSVKRSDEEPVATLIVLDRLDVA